MAANNVECLVIDIKDISRVQKEFPDYYDDLLNDQIINLQSAWIYKLKAMKTCRKQMEIFIDAIDEVVYNCKALYIHQIDADCIEDSQSSESSHSCSHGGAGQVEPIIEENYEDSFGEDESIIVIDTHNAEQ